MQPRSSQPSSRRHSITTAYLGSRSWLAASAWTNRCSRVRSSAVQRPRFAGNRWCRGAPACGSACLGRRYARLGRRRNNRLAGGDGNVFLDGLDAIGPHGLLGTNGDSAEGGGAEAGTLEGQRSTGHQGRGPTAGRDGGAEQVLDVGQIRRKVLQSHAPSLRLGARDPGPRMRLPELRHLGRFAGDPRPIDVLLAGCLLALGHGLPDAIQ